MDSLRSKLLVASPKLPDDNFFRSVVYMIQHDEEGAVGVILNRPTQFRLREVWHAITDSICPNDSPIYRGGPVENQLLALHDMESCGEVQVMDGVYLSMQKESLEVLLSNEVENLRVFSGYAGWGAVQLENEMNTGSWFSADSTIEDVFGEPDGLWEEVAAKIGKQVVFQATDQKNAAGDMLEDDPQAYLNLSGLCDSHFEPNASKIWLN